MKRFSLFVLLPVFLFGLIVYCMYAVYVFDLFGREYRAEQFRLTLDRVFTWSFNTQSFVGRTLPSLIFHNTDKYVFRPPRIIPTHTMQGSLAYEIYGLVDNWDATTKIMELDSYIGKKMFVRFNPNLDGSMAFVPRLDGMGSILSLGENDIITDIKNVRFASLFCPGDVVEVIALNKTDFTHPNTSTLVIPKEIRLSQRLCQTNNP